MLACWLMCIGKKEGGGLRAQSCGRLCAIILLMRSGIFDADGIVLEMIDTFVDSCGFSLITESVADLLPWCCGNMIRFSRNDYSISWIYRSLICDNISLSARSEWLGIYCSAIAGLSEFRSGVEYWSRLSIAFLLNIDLLV